MRYQRIAKQLGQPVDYIGDMEIAFYISSAQQDIQRRLSVVESSTDITLGTTSNLYALPSTFGNVKHAYIGNVPLNEKPIVWAEKMATSESSGDWFAIKVSGHTPYVFCPVQSGTLTVVYYPDLNYYQPSLSATQTWGNFNGVVYSGNAILPDRYNMAIIYNMLSQIFPDYLSIYEKELKSLRESRQFSVEDTLNYNLGGIEEDVPVGSNTASTSVSVTALDTPSKRLRLRADDTGGYTIEYSYGWSSEPTIVNNISTVVISSADSEFTNFVMIRVNNSLFGWTQTSSAITLNASPTSSWGEIEVIIEIFD